MVEKQSKLPCGVTKRYAIFQDVVYRLYIERFLDFRERGHIKVYYSNSREGKEGELPNWNSHCIS